MLSIPVFFIYLLIMAATTYAVRVLPLVLCRGKIGNRFIKSFLTYIPYAVLGAMTVPAILYATGSMLSAVVGLVVAVVLAYQNRGLLTVAAFACLAVYITELFI